MSLPTSNGQINHFKMTKIPPKWGKNSIQVKLFSILDHKASTLYLIFMQSLYQTKYICFLLLLIRWILDFKYKGKTIMPQIKGGQICHEHLAL